MNHESLCWLVCITLNDRGVGFWFRERKESWLKRKQTQPSHNKNARCAGMRCFLSLFTLLTVWLFANLFCFIKELF